MSETLVEVTRGGIVESLHRGVIAVVSSEGEVINELGDINLQTFMRSATKPLQAVAVLETGIAEEFKLDLKDIALILSSHSGEIEHVEALKEIMRKIGIDEDSLKCGVHQPLNKEAAKELASAGEAPTKLHCNCAGKHMGQIAASKIKGLSIDDYYEMNHGIQALIRDVLSKFSGVHIGEIIKGVDGCGIPVYGMPLKNMALAYANLCNEELMGGMYRKSQNYVLSAMTMYPEMVGGTGRFDTLLMKHFGDRLIGKFGDEGIYCIGLTGKKIGIALKIEDGNGRAVGPAVLELLYQKGIIDKDEVELIKEFRNPPLLNHKGEKIGEIRAAFKIPQ